MIDLTTLTPLINGLSVLLISAGAFFFLAGTVGLLRLPDLHSRLHALTKADNLGLGLVVLGVLPRVPDVLYGIKLLLLWIMVLVAGATGAHLIAKRALRGEGEPR
ncbi:MAG: monovalent cation/H(+) antiporter subunit G [Chromatiaceae bacterium]|nr:MAG: monovalent cation/H(+) antiporter subunit G [Chromatiaceae bacterium]